MKSHEQLYREQYGHYSNCQLEKAGRSGWMSTRPPVCTCENIAEELAGQRKRITTKPLREGRMKKGGVNEPPEFAPLGEPKGQTPVKGRYE